MFRSFYMTKRVDNQMPLTYVLAAFFTLAGSYGMIELVHDVIKL